MECMWVLIRLNFSFWLGDALFIISKGITDKYRVEFELKDFIFNLKEKLKQILDSINWIHYQILRVYTKQKHTHFFLHAYS